MSKKWPLTPYSYPTGVSMNARHKIDFHGTAPIELVAWTLGTAHRLWKTVVTKTPKLAAHARPRTKPMIDVRMRRCQSWADANWHNTGVARIMISIGPKDDLIEVEQTILHELCHIWVGEIHGHAFPFLSALRDMGERAFGVRVPIPSSREGRYRLDYDMVTAYREKWHQDLAGGVKIQRPRWPNKYRSLIVPGAHGHLASYPGESSANRD